ncbi:MAG: hypothetical protein ABEJ62_00110 [Candidatus Nanohaloarchaea archaeon]
MPDITFALPVLGEIAFHELALPAVVIGGAIDSVNPCAFGVLIFLMTYLTKVFSDRKRALLGGLLYTGSVFTTYLLSGIGLMSALRGVSPFVFAGIALAFLVSGSVARRWSRTASYWFYGVTAFVVVLAFIAAVPRELASYSFYWVAAFIAFAAGTFEIKDFFWYGKGVSMDMSLVPGSSDRIKMWTKKMEKVSEESPRTVMLMTIVIGFGAAAFELPCTGQVYLVILTLINASGAAVGTWLPWLVLYNLIFVSPLLVITGLMYVGMSSDRLEDWRKRNRRYMRLGIGSFLYFLGAVILWFIFNQFPGAPTLRPLTYLLYSSQVTVVLYVLYKGYFD